MNTQPAFIPRSSLVCQVGIVALRLTDAADGVPRATIQKSFECAVTT
jgi:hypothetical protein